MVKYSSYPSKKPLNLKTVTYSQKSIAANQEKKIQELNYEIIDLKKYVFKKSIFKNFIQKIKMFFGRNK